MCQAGTTSHRACSYVSSSPSNGGPNCLKFCWGSCQNIEFQRKMGIAEVLSVNLRVCESCFGKKVFQNKVCTYYIYKRLMMHPVCTTQGDQRESPFLSVLPLAPALVWLKYKPACAHWNPWSLPGTGEQFQEQIRAGGING